MATKYFGTDGIRGPTGQPPLTPEGVARLASVLAQDLLAETTTSPPRVLVGTDTRQSGVWMSGILSHTLAAHGIVVGTLGVVPTPVVARETRLGGWDVGLMVTASHNPHTDNGFKLFGRDGYKLSDAVQARLERALDAPPVESADAESQGQIEQVTRDQSIAAALIETLSAPPSLQGYRLVVDGAHGAAHQLGPEVFRRLGADVIAIGDAPNGRNINAGVGATHPEALGAAVKAHKAYAGLAFDGDADRLIMVDEQGAAVDGDQLIALLAATLAETGRLTGDGVVATVMSNLGLERHLKAGGLKLHRTAVGDRHVVEAMRSGGYNLGGEQSGHLVLLDHTTTGDGVLAGLHVMAAAVARGVAFSQVGHVFDPVPQTLVNIRFAGADPMENEQVKTVMAKVEEALGEDGRILVRKSGTEPLIRIMVEALNVAERDAAMAELERAVHDAIRP